MGKKAPLGGETWLAIGIFMPFLQNRGHPEFVSAFPPSLGKHSLLQEQQSPVRSMVSPVPAPVAPRGI